VITIVCGNNRKDTPTPSLAHVMWSHELTSYCLLPAVTRQCCTTQNVYSKAQIWDCSNLEMSIFGLVNLMFYLAANFVPEERTTTALL
jgi:hypothetical protein